MLYLVVREIAHSRISVSLFNREMPFLWLLLLPALAVALPALHNRRGDPIELTVGINMMSLKDCGSFVIYKRRNQANPQQSIYSTQKLR